MTQPETRMPRTAFAADARILNARSAVKAAFWSLSATAGRALVRPASRVEATDFEPVSPPADPARLRAAWLEAFAKDAADVAAGLYPVAEAAPSSPLQPLRTVADLVRDGRRVEGRRRDGGGLEARQAEESEGFPSYYRQNFHFQTGGWFTPESARRYEAQVEALFAGAAGPMRRRALSLLAKAWRTQDHRGRRVLDLACGSGAFLTDLKAAFPRAEVVGLDASRAYLDEARRRSGAPGVQALAERLPFADASLDAATCVFLFHELPPKVRSAVAAEVARVLKPGGVFVMADSIQAADDPSLARLLETFPVNFPRALLRELPGDRPCGAVRRRRPAARGRGPGVPHEGAPVP